MLRSLRVRNLVILEDVSLEFGPGLNILTGETGAGKSILVDAVGLATGDRAEGQLEINGSFRRHQDRRGFWDVTGTWTSGLRASPPASRSSTEVSGSALSRLASTQPAEPAPTMT